MKRTEYIFLGMALLALIALAIMGCQKATESTPQNGEPATKVKTLELFLPQGKNWDADPEADGIEVEIEPKDENDNMVNTSGKITAKLWYKQFSTGEQGDLIQEWSF